MFMIRVSVSRELPYLLSNIIINSFPGAIHVRTRLPKIVKLILKLFRHCQKLRLNAEFKLKNFIELGTKYQGNGDTLRITRPCRVCTKNLLIFFHHFTKTPGFVLFARQKIN